jgi:hypothetical protein
VFCFFELVLDVLAFLVLECKFEGGDGFAEPQNLMAGQGFPSECFREIWLDGIGGFAIGDAL